VKSINLPSDMLTSNVYTRISRVFYLAERKYLGLGHVFQGKEVDDTIEYTSRVEFLRCGKGLKSLNHGHSPGGVLDLFALLILLLVPFPDTCRYRDKGNERRRTDTSVQTTDMHYQRYRPGCGDPSILTIIMVVLLIGEAQLEGVGYDTTLVALGAFEQVPIALEDQWLGCHCG